MSDDAGLRRMVTERVESVEPAVREVLELLALGEPLPIEALAELVAPEALDAAERAGLVSVALEGRRRQCRFAHPLYGDAVVASLTPEAVRARCAALASVLAREPGPEPADVVRLALLRLEAGEVVAAGRLEAAAGHASAALDHPLAEHLARAAVDAGGGTEARFLLANAVLWQGRLAEADHHLATLEAADLSDQHRVRVARQRAGLLFWSLDRAADAEGVLRRADALVTDERARLELVGLRSCFLAFQGVIGEAITAADRVMTSDAAEPSAVLWAAMGATLASGLVGWCDDAAISAARGRTVLAACPGDMSQLAAALADCECTALSLAGRVSDAASRAEEVVAWATAEANGMLAAAGATLRAQAELGRGDLASAAGLFREALAGLADFDPGGWRYHCHLGLAEAGAAQGDAAAARADLSAAEDLRPAARPVFRSKELLVECRVVAAAGDLRRAAAIATSSAGAAQELGLWATEALALHAALRLSSTAEATEVTDRLAALAGLVDNPLVAACAAHARALAAGDGPSLAEVGARFEHMELRLPAADAYAHAATAFAAAGEDRAALHAAAQARTLLRRCGAGPTPATARLPLAPSLTPREREIATLAGAGVSNKAIAARLDVSVRTVEGHLALAYAKLAVHRRDDLATALQSLA
jgi:DNA-binding CsgD family transcriptional regulator